MKRSDVLDLSVLYVEDEPEAREEMASLLRRRVRTVVEAENGRQGVEMFGRQHFDVVVTDLRMPELDGLSMVQLLRAKAPEVQVIVTTAHGDSAHLMEAIEAGVDHFVLKPVVFSTLLRALQRSNDVIAYRRAEARHKEEREALIGDLTAALERVKQLSGLLPICSWCKKIRDDQGYWQRLEAYLMEHTDAQFTHSVCPTCLAERIPPEDEEAPAPATGT